MTEVGSVQSATHLSGQRVRDSNALLRDLDGYMSSGSSKLYKQTQHCTVLYKPVDNAELTSSLQILCPSKISVVPKALIPASLAAKFLLFQVPYSSVLILS